MSPQPERKARLRISIDLVMQVFDIPTDVQLRDVRMNLWDGPYVELLIESPHLPERDPGCYLPIFTPVYERPAVGEARMVEFEGYAGELDGARRRQIDDSAPAWRSTVELPGEVP